MVSFSPNDDAKQAYEILLTVRAADNRQRLYLLAQEVGLLELIRLHIPRVLAERFPENQLIARAHGIKLDEGGSL